jgi:hypothetical protein
LIFDLEEDVLTPRATNRRFPRFKNQQSAINPKPSCAWQSNLSPHAALLGDLAEEFFNFLWALKNKTDRSNESDHSRVAIRRAACQVDAPELD